MRPEGGAELLNCEEPAILELVCEQLDDDELVSTLDGDPAVLGAALAAVLPVLRRATPRAAGEAAHASGLLHPAGPLAPIGPAHQLTTRPRNPVLAAAQLASLADRLSPADQLMFRTGTAHPAYPATKTGQTAWAVERLPSHPRRLPDPDLAWVPARLWPGSIPGLLPAAERDGPDPDGLAAAALLFGKVGNPQPWALIALDLGLPCTLAGAVGTWCRRLRRGGAWPQLHQALEDLMTRLQHNPPPIDYRTRRILGDDTRLLTTAITWAATSAGQGLHLSAGSALGTSMEMLVARFWELFTGGHISYGPPPLRLADPDALRRFAAARPGLDVSHAQLFAHAYALVRCSDTLPVHGPLTWRPP